MERIQDISIAQLQNDLKITWSAEAFLKFSALWKVSFC